MQERFVCLQAAMRFPGLRKHHGLRVEVTYQDTMSRKTVRSWNSMRYMSFPIIAPKKYVNDLRSLKVDYDFPICYPDWHTGHVCYIKRLQAKVFYDLVDRSYPPKAETRFTNEIGINLSTTMHFFATQPPMTIGVQYCNALEQNKGAIALTLDLQT